mgnify:CR=1 FL=1
MTRFLPRSLLGQVMLALAAALLIAQAISATMLYRAASERRELAVTSAASFQLLVGQRRDLRDERRRRARPPSGRPGPVEDEPFIRLPRSIRFSQSQTSPLLSGEERNSAREAAITRQLERQGLEVAEIVVTDRSLESDPLVGQLEQTHPVWDQRLRTAPHELLVVGLRQAGTDGWQVARLAVPPPDRGIVRTLVLQTLILFLVLVGLLYFVLRRITRPLAALADRTRRFGSAGAPEEPLVPSGPQDVRRLIEAHNAMQGRIGSMLDEKDVMLGAIGHDLKTPLAALRVRIESVEDEGARHKMAATIEDITRTLDEILSLARIGRSDAPPEMNSRIWASRSRLPAAHVSPPRCISPGSSAGCAISSPMRCAMPAPHMSACCAKTAWRCCGSRTRARASPQTAFTKCSSPSRAARRAAIVKPAVPGWA